MTPHGGRVLRIVAVALIAVLAPMSCIWAEDKVVSDSDAGAYVGVNVSVQGIVEQVFTSRAGNTFLNFGGRYPNQTFAAVIFSSAASRFQNPKQWEGRKVMVRGLVKLYKGRPEIILEDPAQLSAVK